MGRPSSLPVHPRDLALTELKKHTKPMSAYDLLAKLEPHGVKGAPVVYRALDNLIKTGVVHKIKELNAFIACNCKPDHAHSLSDLTVCQDCEKVEELHDHGVIHQLEGLRKKGVRLIEHAVIELPITCPVCAI